MDSRAAPLRLLKFVIAALFALTLRGEINVWLPPYNADPFGAIDTTAGIQTAFNVSNGETVYVPAGTYINAGLILPSNLHLRCDGEGTVFVTKAGSNADAMTTAGAGPLFGSGLQGGVNGLELEGFVIDGNKANNSSGRGIVAYWYGSKLRNIIVRNCKNAGIYEEWALGGYPAPNRSMENDYNNVKVVESDDVNEAWHHNGPHDSRFYACATIAGIGLAGFHVGPNGNGAIFTSCHPWGYIQIGRSPQWAIIFDGVNCEWNGSVAEGGSTGQILIRASGISIVGGEQYNIVNAFNQKGIQIGDAAHGYTSISGTVIRTRLINFFNGGIVFDSEYGLSDIDVAGWNSLAGSKLFMGLPAASSRLTMKIGGPGGGFIFKIPTLQTTPAGLISGSFWNNNGVLSIVP